MNKFLLPALLMFLISLSASSQPRGRQSRNSEVKQELIQLEKDWSTAFLKHDTATIARILADEFVGIDGRGLITNKTQEIDEAQSPKPGAPEPPFLILDEAVVDLKARVYGNTAVVNGRVIEKIRTKAGETQIQYRRTTVWVNRQGRWQCVSFHGSRILDPPG